MKLKKLRWTAIFGVLLLVTACGTDVSDAPGKIVPATPAPTAPAAIRSVSPTTNITSPTRSISTVTNARSAGITTIRSTTPAIVTTVASTKTVVLATTTALLLPPKTLENASTDSFVREWSKRWVEGIPCKAPCWEGITPGKTTADEAMAILTARPTIFTKVYKWIHQANSRTDTPGTGAIYWEWAGDFGKLPRITGGGGMGFDDKQIIGGINPGIPLFQVTLQELIQAYGEPKHVQAYSFRGQKGYLYSELTFYFLNYGLVMYLPSDFSNPVKPIISPQLIQNYIPAFDIPGHLEKEWKSRETSAMSHGPTILVPWQGYKNFDFYCRNGRLGTCEPD